MNQRPNPSPWRTQVKRSAEKEIARLPASAFNRVVEAIRRLNDNPRPRGAIKLKGSEKHRLRVGDYRILYSIDDKTRLIEIVSVANRREAYRSE